MNVSASAAVAVRPPSDASSAPPSFSLREVEQTAPREAARLEDVAGPIEQADDAHRRLAAFGAAI